MAVTALTEMPVRDTKPPDPPLATAPQAALVRKPPFVKGDRVRLVQQGGFGARAGAIAVVAEDYDPDGYLQLKWEDGPLRCGQRDGGYFVVAFEAAAPTPVPAVAAPDAMGLWHASRIPAVPPEGLAILPQTGVRHDRWEEAARAAEKDEAFPAARSALEKARAALAADLAYDAEADAIRCNRIIRKDALAQLGTGDRECFRLRNLRDFTIMASAAHSEWKWWER